MSDHREVKVELENAVGEQVPATITFSRRAPWSLRLDAQGLESIDAQASDLFECLVSVRKKLQERGFKLLCNAARRDVYPSGMSRQMSGGACAYVLRMGHPGKSKDIVNIFDPASKDVVASIEDQKEYFEKWSKSLG